jgi:hypothetical protein
LDTALPRFAHCITSRAGRLYLLFHLALKAEFAGGAFKVPFNRK